MRLIKSFSNLLLCTLIFASCNKGTSPTYNDRPVVTGYLKAGTAPLITISKQASTSSDIVFSAENIDSLQIYLSNGTDEFLLVHTDSGRYTSETILIEEGKTYSLHFAYNGKMVTATTTIPSKPQGYTESVEEIWLQKIDSNTTFSPGSISMPDPVELAWANSDNSYYLVVAENMEEEPELVRDTLSGFAARPDANFRNEPSITTEAMINSMQFEYFGKYRLILYKLLPEYAALYEEVSNSSTSLTTPSSNIENGFGIFSGINADTLYLQVSKY